MPTNFNAKIKDVPAGADFDVSRTIGSVPSGAILSKAYLTVKTNETDLKSLLRAFRKHTVQRLGAALTDSKGCSWSSTPGAETKPE